MYSKLASTLKRVDHESLGVPANVQERRKAIIDELVRAFRTNAGIAKLVRDIGYYGSAYERLQSGTASDYDLQLFLSLSETSPQDWRVVDHDNSGQWGILKYVGPHADLSYLHNKRLSGVKARQTLKSLIDQVIDRHSTRNFRVTTSAKGPAVTLRITPNGSQTFDVDLVIAVDGCSIGADRDFVAKPKDKTNPMSHEMEPIWRSSYSKKEKEWWDGKDRGNLVHKKVLRIFKAARRQNPQLKMLPSYVYKNIMMHLSDEAGKEWDEGHIAERFVDMVNKTEQMLRAGNVPLYFNREVNLLTGCCNQGSRLQVSDYLKTRVIGPGENGYIGLISMFVAQEAQINRPRQAVPTHGG